MTTEPVSWGRSRLGWSQDGYTLLAPHWVEERALYECEAELRQAIADALESHPSVSVRLTAMEVTRTSTSADADPGELEIVTPEKMISPAEATELREAVSLLLRNAVAATERLIEADDAAAKLVRETLQEPSA